MVQPESRCSSSGLRTLALVLAIIGMYLSDFLLRSAAHAEIVIRVGARSITRRRAALMILGWARNSPAARNRDVGLLASWMLTRRWNFLYQVRATPAQRLAAVSIGADGAPLPPLVYIPARRAIRVDL